MAFDAKPDWPDTPAVLHLYVEDGDTVYEGHSMPEPQLSLGSTHLYVDDAEVQEQVRQFERKVISGD